MVAPTDIPGVVSESGLLPSLYGGGVPVSLEDIKRRRAIAAALASRARPFPKTIGEGLTSLGEAFGDVMADRRLSEQEQAYGARRGAAVNAPLGGVPPARVPAAPASAIVKPVAAVTAPTMPKTADPRAAIAAAVDPNDPALVALAPSAPSRGVASPDPTQAGATEPPQTSPIPSDATLAAAGEDDPLWPARMGAISGIETRGVADPYRAVGAPTKYGRGLGRYQVVEANVAPWTQAALGQALTPQQFLASEDAQDAVFKHRFGQYVDQFGEEGAARAWFGGPGNVNKADLTDRHKRLSIGNYGKSYMAGLEAGTDPTQVAAYAPTGTATDAPSPAARGGAVIPPLTEENPVTPSDITPAPIRVAEERGGVTIPGPLERITPPPKAPTTGLAPTPPNYPKIGPEPTLPDPTPITPEEIRARELVKQFPGDEQVAAIAKQLDDFGKGQRLARDTRNAELYRSKVETYRARTLASETVERERPQKEWEFTQKQEAAAREEADRIKFPLGRAEADKRMKESFDTAKGIPASNAAIANVRQALPQMFSGQFADAALGLAKFKTAIGAPEDPRITPTESFRGFIVPILAQLRPAIVGAGAQSLPELKLLEDAAAGNIKLEPASIGKIVDAIEKLNLVAATQHHKVLLANSGEGDPAMLRHGFGNYGLPMERLVPPRAVEILRKGVADGDPNVMKEFDDDFNTPGLARKILGGR